MTSWQHDALANDLAEHLRRSGDRMVWTDMQMGPSGSPRPDVYTIPKQYSRFTPLAYECKISVADFRRDIVAGKWQSYLKFAAGVIFCVPAGLISKADIPTGCGLMVRHDAIWRAAKGPTLSRVENLPLTAWMKLLIDGAGRAAVSARQRSFDGYSLAQAARKKFGDRIGDLLQYEEAAERRLQHAIEALKARTAGIEAEEKALVERAEREAAGIVAEARASLRELAVELGLSPDAHRHSVMRAVRDIAAALKADVRVRGAEHALDLAEEAIRAARQKIPAIVREVAA
jgi:hypothetical protein